MLAGTAAKKEGGVACQTNVVGLAHRFVRGIAEFLAHELVLPVACFVLVIGHEARYDKRHCVLRVGCRY